MGESYVIGLFRVGEETIVLAVVPDSQAAPLLAQMAREPEFRPRTSSPAAAMLLRVQAAGVVILALVLVYLRRRSSSATRE